jgi:hypothetical protein
MMDAGKNAAISEAQN